MNKIIMCFATGCLVTLMSSPVFATSYNYTIYDNFVGGNTDNPGNLATSEVIGDDKYWSVSKMDVNISRANNKSQLTVDIHSRFLNNIGYHNVYMGDLFISTNGWTPLAPTSKDVYTDGEDWEYVLSLDYDRYKDYAAISGTTSLYNTAPGTIVLPETQDPNNRADYYRAGQEIFYLPGANQASLGSGTWSIENLNTSEDTDDYLRFVIDSAIFNDVTEFGFRWQMTCANDIIEGGITTAPVPEPATMLLFGSGLLGLGSARLRRKKK